MSTFLESCESSALTHARSVKFDLSEQFSALFKLHAELVKKPDPAKISFGLVRGLSLHYQIQQEGVFSSNELFEDVNAEDIKFLLVPYFLGDICSMIADVENREMHVKASNV